MANQRYSRNGTAPVPAPAPAPAAPKAAEVSTNRPVHEVCLGRICGAVWEQPGTDGRTWHTVTLSRIYQTDAGTWARSESFGRTDLPLVAKVADQCHTWMYQQTKEENG